MATSKAARRRNDTSASNESDKEAIGGMDADARHDADLDQPDLTLDERQEKAYRLHLRGYSMRAIARELSVDKDTANAWIKKVRVATAPRRKAVREQALREAIERLREIQHAAWLTHMEQGDVMALNTALATEREIAKLRGLYDAVDDEGQSAGVTITITKRGVGTGIRVRNEDGEGNE